MRLAAVPRAGAFAAVLGAGLATFAALALAVAAFRPLSAARAASQAGYLVDAHAIPLLFAAKAVLFAYALLDCRVVAARRSVSFAAVGAAALPAVLRTGEAVLIAAAGAVSASAASTALPAFEFDHFINANLVPGVLTTEGVFRTDAGLDSGVVAAGAIVRFAAGAFAGARATVLGTGGTGFPGGTDFVSAV